ncbi:carboxylesterase/lipase family protein [Lentzea albidocapillata]|uniref:Carboxylic ester hydrolase n=1 Tax=Lentzea albidocapillata TaxID=40571 RepID=A0A1W2CDI4_9PSEU|nr:carboxylesterase family protein [Lentzea albidocapillata]SMC83219.1 para-nitrobenzyl esterase [Lentzea albidocapillata]
MKRLLTAAMAAALAFTITQVPAQAEGEGGVVRTDKGAVRGTVTDTYRTFGNIPFAAAPVGANRWRDPQPAAPWQGVRDATRPAPVCAQTAQLGQPGSETEDCLYLNVTTPATAPKKPRPVMVWIHGGGFTGGGASLYDARQLATRNDAVVVTVNYRLGVFGYFGHPGLPGSGAFGLADQQAALRWVQRNARAFGGNPGNVTIFGESAGGLSVCAQLASPRAAGLFAKAIIQSGPCGLVSPSFTEPGKFTHVWKSRTDVEKQGTGTLGCADVACLRAKPVAELLTVHEQFASPAFDTAVMPVDPVVAQRTGRLHRVPTMIGSTHDEFTLFAALIWAQPLPEAGYRAQVAGLFGQAPADRIVARYPVNGNDDARDELARLLTDASWACPTDTARKEIGRHTRVSGYEFADPDAPLIFPGLPPFPDYGAYHASELLSLFEFPGVQLTPAQRRLSDYMITAWGRFARTGDPGWRPDVQSLAPGAIGGTDFAREHQCGFWSSIL